MKTKKEINEIIPGLTIEDLIKRITESFFLGLGIAYGEKLLKDINKKKKKESKINKDIK